MVTATDPLGKNSTDASFCSAWHPVLRLCSPADTKCCCHVLAGDSHGHQAALGLGEVTHALVDATLPSHGVGGHGLNT